MDAALRQGEYREVREVVFSPTGDRTERFAGQPVSRLKNLELTPEDFADIRNIQPFVFTEDKLPIYDVQYKGEERVGDRELLGARRFGPSRYFFGTAALHATALLWIAQDDFSVIPGRRESRTGDRSV